MAIDGDGRRVALLARPGLARERLSGVLQEAGANCVIAADPTQIKPDELRGAQPQVVLVALDPLTEEALDQFDEVLGDRAVEVIYEEAEHAASREGWDAARWKRHLVAKLQGHSNVLPPGRAPHAPSGASAEAAGSDPLAQAAPDEVGTLDAFGSFGEPGITEVADMVATSGISETSESSGTFETYDAPAPIDEPAPSAATPGNAFDPVNAELDDLASGIDFGGMELDTMELDASIMELSSSDPALPFFESSFQELSFGDLTLDEPDLVGSADRASSSPSLELSEPGEATLADTPPADDGLQAFDFTLDADSTAATAEDGQRTGVFDDFDDFDAATSRVAAPAEDDAPAGPPAGLSLQDDEAELRLLDTPQSREGFRHDLLELEQRISSMSLVDDTPRRGPDQIERGAVLIIGGLGGPDAVRQLLGAMPVGFARPVLVQQRLEGGRYDRLVTQLQRATELTVLLAEPEQTAEPGTVYILGDAVGAKATADGIRFSDDASDSVMAALPSSDSAVLLLSGSDPTLVEAAMTHSVAGALVMGQSADGCYDATAPSALAARGGEVAAPAALALRLRARWSNRGTSNAPA